MTKNNDLLGKFELRKSLQDFMARLRLMSPSRMIPNKLSIACR